MNSLQLIPEIEALSFPKSLIRLPDQVDVPVTPRIMRLIDSAAFQRLKKVSQLGFVSWVYPGATHSRFEHSLGVYRLTLLVLRNLAGDGRFCERVTDRDAELLIVSALLHDIAHWPFCHPLEDLQLDCIPHHESLAGAILKSTEISAALQEDWALKPEDVNNLLNKNIGPQKEIISSILSGPIDVDKMDYLVRDSLHAGVPYGRNFDSPRLISSLCLNQKGNRIAITEKGKTAAELMVFARYVMFSEVYWHHAVRSATAMFQRAFYLISGKLNKKDFEQLFLCSDDQIATLLYGWDSDGLAKPLLDGLFGKTRHLYKRWGQFGHHELPHLHHKIARKPYTELVRATERIAQAINSFHPELKVNSNEILLDAPPVGLEVQFDVDVFKIKTEESRKLGDLSPVVRSLANDQFDNFVKQVRVFVSPRLAISEQLRSLEIVPLLSESFS